ncbi:MAG: hypothetical protein AAFQ94_26995 [Bacteroidota bacterium]
MIGIRTGCLSINFSGASAPITQNIPRPVVNSISLITLDAANNPSLPNTVNVTSDPSAFSYTYALDDNLNYSFVNNQSRSITTHQKSVKLQCENATLFAGYLTITCRNACGTSDEKVVELSCLDSGAPPILNFNLSARAKVYPSKISAGQMLNVTDITGDIKRIELISLANRSTTITLNKGLETEGKDHLKISTNELSKGLHVLQIRYADGTVKKQKILVK